MKKILLSMLMIAIVTTTNAQLWIGGGVGFNSGSIKNVADSETKSNKDSLTLSISPKIGYRINKLDIGLKFTYATTRLYPDKEKNDNNWNQTTGYSISAFARYGLISVGDFSLRAVADFSCGISAPKTSKGEKDKEPKITEGDKTTAIAFNLYPMLSYSLSNHFELEADLNFLGLTASFAKKSIDDDKVDRSVNYSSMGLAINNNAAAISNLMNVGLIYKF